MSAGMQLERVPGALALGLVPDPGGVDHLLLLGLALLVMGPLVWSLVWRLARRLKGHTAALAVLRRELERTQGLREQAWTLAQQEQAARAAAEIRHLGKTQLIATASHDLRQPLLALNLYERQLRERLRDPLDADLLDGVARSLQSLEAMLGDLLDDARCEAGAATAALQPVALAPLFKSLAYQVGPCALDRGLHLAWHGGHRHLWGDAVWVERVLRNLILNAIAHTAKGGVVVGARRRGSCIVLQVWDTGCGLQAHECERVFDDHYTTHDRTNSLEGQSPGIGVPRRHGTGLGLGIVRRLSHLMGATVSLRSRPGRGTLFEVVFPAAPPAQP